jgi:hypothetical protein
MSAELVWTYCQDSHGLGGAEAADEITLGRYRVARAWSTVAAPK